MSDPTVQLMTIVAEAVLEERLERDVGLCGASGWTITPCRGVTRDEGHGGGAADIEGGNIRLEVLIHADGLEQLWSVLERDYFASFAVVAWSNSVRVGRAGKFRRDPTEADDA